ncbi:MAG: molecular chaperone DnaK, partial [Verrucomicrobia bacterium]|nr:molecular chaperone DnaK [Verrucomicrobiota bacterium]
SDAGAIKRASEKLNETWQVVSAELYKAASEKSRASHGPAGSQSGTQSEAGGTPDASEKDEGPIIDAEVVEEKKAA